MAFKRTHAAAGLTTADPVAIGNPIYLGAAYARVVGFQARNWASSAKAAGGTDNAARIKLTDANGMIFYLDAADKDYKTATVWKFIEADDTITGLSYVVVDSTGAAVAAGQTVENIIVASPVTVTAVGFGTATDYLEVYLFVDDGSGNAPTRN